MTAAGRRAGAAIVLAALAGSGDGAVARTMQQKFDDACGPAIARLCPGMNPASDAVKACLLRRRGDVDEACLRLVDASE